MKKLETRKLIAKLEKTSRKTGKNIWKDLAERLEKPKRNNTVINVGKLNMLGEKFKGKTLIVPGKILSEGIMNNNVKVVGVDASTKAIEKISENGEFVYLKDFVDEKVNVKEIIMVK